jgi:hypothetical protein
MSIDTQSSKAHENMTVEEREAEHVRLIRVEIEATKSGILKRAQQAAAKQADESKTKKSAHSKSVT